MDEHTLTRIREHCGGEVPPIDSLRLMIEADPRTRRPVACGGDSIFGIEARRRPVQVLLKPATELWTGDRVPPDFADGPPPEYEAFFGLIESTAAAYCVAAGSPVRDREFERLYDYAAKRPDGRDNHPAFGYIVGAARLYMSVVATSRAEYEAVMRRLKKSASTFAVGPVSSNYFEFALMRAE